MVGDRNFARQVCQERDIDLIVNFAAETHVDQSILGPLVFTDTNVRGKHVLLEVVQEPNPCLHHISTDDVLSGEKGGYREDDPLGPPVNYYALSKLVAEEVARCAERHLIVRTSFRPREWPYDTAFTDVFTSQDYVDVIAPEVALVVRHTLDIDDDTLHVANERKSVCDSLRRRPEVRPGTRESAVVVLPGDVSLNTDRWEQLKQQFSSVSAPRS